MIDRMSKYSFILLRGEQDNLLETLQEIGLVDITRSAKATDEHSSRLSADLELTQGLIQGLEKVQVPPDVVPEYTEGDIVRLAGGMLMRYSDDKNKIDGLEKKIAELRAWGHFDQDTLDALERAGVPVHFHRVPAKQFKAEWAQEYALTEVSRDKTTVWFAVAGPDGLPGEVSAPKEDFHTLEKELEQERRHFGHLMSRIAGVKERIGELKEKMAADYAALDLYLAGAAAVPAVEGNIVTLVGYAPAENDAAITAALERTGVFYLKDAAVAQDNPPIRFRNNWFVRQFEVLTDMYGRPAYDGFDPTPFIAFFFLLFFAFCMGDCGYGLILLAAGLLMRKSAGFRDMAPLVTILGAGTTVIGFLFHTFFSMDISTWEIFAPVKGIFLPGKIMGYDGTMVLSIIVGIVHLCLAMCVKTYEETKNKGLGNSLGTWGWTLLIVGGVIVAGLSLIGVLDQTATKWSVIVLGVVSAVGIFLFNDPSRSKLANIGSGLWTTYNTVTGLLGDILSYLRLYALGLAGSMLGMAFNSIGQMIIGDGSNAFLWIFFVLIVVIGHTLNIAMAALGAFVHPLRLNFLEFFKNSGYEAAGRNYHPLSK